MRVVGAVLLAGAAGCFQLSPHDLPELQDHNLRAVERLAATPIEGPLRFVLIGDTQREFDAAAAFVEAVNRRGDVHFVVELGDFTNTGLTFEWEAMRRVFDGLRMPWLAVIGNHDFLANGRLIYEHMFGPRNLAFTVAGVRLVLLDTNSREAGFPQDVPDLAWLEAQLAPDGAHDRSAVLGHVGPNSEDLREDLKPGYRALLREAGAPGFHAHGHKYEAYEQDGARFYTADAVGHGSYLLVTAGPGGGFEVERVFF
ncbi:MAG: metallophosphoesterase [Anaeromyxobacter sp.]